MDTIHEQIAVSDTPRQEIERLFLQQREHQQVVARTTARERIAKLRMLHKGIMANRQAIRDAMYRDFRKHPSEVDLTEIYPVVSDIKHAILHLRRWMSPRRVAAPLPLLGTSSYIHYEPKGVVLIISPWNFPVNLTFGPLVSAIAAGNCALLKPSELTPHTSAVMRSIVADLFDPREVALIEGAVATSQALLDLPFNHIFFTGSPAVGKIVMAAAARHLSSVTLELGGKSPTIIDESADIDKAARRLAWAKCLNNGQICIAPDYVFVHERQREAFLEKMTGYIRQFYGDNAASADAYARLVNDRHFARVKGYVDDALAKGARLVAGGQVNQEDAFIAPTILTDVDPQSSLMQEEIFGPVLPVYTFRDLQEPLDVINSKEKPLVLYIYSNNRRTIRRIIENTRAGGTSINHSGVYYFNNNLPFGGSNHSGIGKGHGFFGFEAFSNPRGVFRQVVPWSAIELMMPPYTRLKQKIIDWSIKYF